MRPAVERSPSWRAERAEAGERATDGQPRRAGHPQPAGRRRGRNHGRSSEARAAVSAAERRRPIWAAWMRPSLSSRLAPRSGRGRRGRFIRVGSVGANGPGVRRQPRPLRPSMTHAASGQRSGPQSGYRYACGERASLKARGGRPEPERRQRREQAGPGPPAAGPGRAATSRLPLARAGPAGPSDRKTRTAGDFGEVRGRAGQGAGPTPNPRTDPAAAEGPTGKSSPEAAAVAEAGGQSGKGVNGGSSAARR